MHIHQQNEKMNAFGLLFQHLIHCFMHSDQKHFFLSNVVIEKCMFQRPLYIRCYVKYFSKTQAQTSFRTETHCIINLQY